MCCPISAHDNLDANAQYGYHIEFPGAVHTVFNIGSTFLFEVEKDKIKLYLDSASTGRQVSIAKDLFPPESHFTLSSLLNGGINLRYVAAIAGAAPIQKSNTEIAPSFVLQSVDNTHDKRRFVMQYF